jgi:translocator protein
MALIYVGYLFFLISTIAWIVILIHAFKASVGQGFLCLCIMPYAIYYAFAKYQSPKKGLIIAMFLGGYIIGGALYGIGIGQAASAAMKQLGDIKIEVPAKTK